MGKWLAEFQENTLETGIQTTDKTDRSCDVTVLSVPNQGFLTGIDNIAMEIVRWNPELAEQGYVWCMDCQYWNNLACKHIDNPYRKKCAHAPRICKWYEATE